MGVGDKEDDAEPVSAEGLHGISARLGNLLEMGFEVSICFCFLVKLVHVLLFSGRCG